MANLFQWVKGPRFPWIQGCLHAALRTYRLVGSKCKVSGCNMWFSYTRLYLPSDLASTANHKREWELQSIKIESCPLLAPIQRILRHHSSGYCDKHVPLPTEILLTSKWIHLPHSDQSPFQSMNKWLVWTITFKISHLT